VQFARHEDMEQERRAWSARRSCRPASLSGKADVWFPDVVSCLKLPPLAHTDHAPLQGKDEVERVALLST
jgi:hypothetical protein